VWAIGRHADDRFDACQSAPLGRRWKKGEENQAAGRSRGGRNTKIHALADAKGRLIAILLSGGEAHDCPLAERLIRRVKSPERLLGDKAYDSAELREALDERGTKPVIPNRCNRKQPFIQLQQASLQAALAHRECLQRVEGLQAHRHTIRQVGPELLGVRLSCSHPGMVDLMSLDPSTSTAKIVPPFAQLDWGQW
jgi:transposase